MRIYLDNNATTAIHPDVLSLLEGALRDVYGNASSIHQEGQAARRLIEDARDSLSRAIGATAREVVFTSGGTESNNAAIFGASARHGRFHIVTSAIEHPSVVEPLRELERRGCEVTRVLPSRSGLVDANAIVGAFRPETRLVTVMLANNETGVVQPVAGIGRAARERGIHVHCDAVQGLGKIPIDVEALGCDTLSLSAHKAHAPKGVGLLYVRRGVEMSAQILGGAQERRRRAGTENVPLAAAFAAAVRLPSAAEQMRVLRDRLESALRETLDVTVNGADVERVPNTSNITFNGADGEGLVIGLDLAGIAVSTGSACSSGRVEPSPVLLAMGMSGDEARSTVRFSLSRFTTAEEIERTVESVRQVLPRCLRGRQGA